jgi:hypothetical protein
MAFFAQTTASFCKNCDHNIGFWEKRHFFAENWEKSQKIVIITSTPGHTGFAYQSLFDIGINLLIALLARVWLRTSWKTVGWSRFVERSSTKDGTLHPPPKFGNDCKLRPPSSTTRVLPAQLKIVCPHSLCAPTLISFSLISQFYNF